MQTQVESVDECRAHQVAIRRGKVKCLCEFGQRWKSQAGVLEELSACSRLSSLLKRWLVLGREGEHLRRFTEATATGGCGLSRQNLGKGRSNVGLGRWCRMNGIVVFNVVLW